MENLEMEEVQEWYYDEDGEISGPVTKTELQKLYREGTVSEKTEVWKNGMATWTELAKAEGLKQKNSTKTMEKKAGDSSLVWILSFLPLFIAGSIWLENLPLFIILVVLNVVICVTDAILLKKSGYIKTDMLLLAIFFAPVYLFRRAYILKEKYGYAILWSICFIIIFIVPGKLFNFHLIPDVKPVTSNVEAEENGSAGSTNNTENSSEPDLTIQKFVDHYITEPSYKLTDNGDGQSVFKVSGTMTYQGKQVNAVLEYGVESDGSVHFETMSFDGLEQGEEIYQQLLSDMQ